MKTKYIFVNSTNTKKALNRDQQRHSFQRDTREETKEQKRPRNYCKGWMLLSTGRGSTPGPRGTPLKSVTVWSFSHTHTNMLSSLAHKPILLHTASHTIPHAHMVSYTYNGLFIHDVCYVESQSLSHTVTVSYPQLLSPSYTIGLFMYIRVSHKPAGAYEHPPLASLPLTLALAPPPEWAPPRGRGGASR